MALEITSRTISVILNRLKGIPRSAGSSQASAFICAISSAGKKEWPTSSWLIDKSLLPFIEKPLTPFTNCFSWKIEFFTDFIILHAFCGRENYSCSDHISKRCRIFSRQRNQIISFFIGQNNFKWALFRHDTPFLTEDIMPQLHAKVNN